jgi:hypothetical protein
MDDRQPAFRIAWPLLHRDPTAQVACSNPEEHNLGLCSFFVVVETCNLGIAMGKEE